MIRFPCRALETVVKQHNFNQTTLAHPTQDQSESANAVNGTRAVGSTEERNEVVSESGEPAPQGEQNSDGAPASGVSQEGPAPSLSIAAVAPAVETSAGNPVPFSEFGDSISGERRPQVEITDKIQQVETGVPTGSTSIPSVVPASSIDERSADGAKTDPETSRQIHEVPVLLPAVVSTADLALPTSELSNTSIDQGKIAPESTKQTHQFPAVASTVVEPPTLPTPTLGTFSSDPGKPGPESAGEVAAIVPTAPSLPTSAIRDSVFDEGKSGPESTKPGEDVPGLPPTVVKFKAPAVPISSVDREETGPESVKQVQQTQALAPTIVEPTAPAVPVPVIGNNPSVGRISVPENTNQLQGVGSAPLEVVHNVILPKTIANADTDKPEEVPIADTSGGRGRKRKQPAAKAQVETTRQTRKNAANSGDAAKVDERPAKTRRKAETSNTNLDVSKVFDPPKTRGKARAAQLGLMDPASKSPSVGAVVTRTRAQLLETAPSSVGIGVGEKTSKVDASTVDTLGGVVFPQAVSNENQQTDGLTVGAAQLKVLGETQVGGPSASTGSQLKSLDESTPVVESPDLASAESQKQKPSCGKAVAADAPKNMDNNTSSSVKHSDDAAAESARESPGQTPDGLPVTTAVSDGQVAGSKLTNCSGGVSSRNPPVQANSPLTCGPSVTENPSTPVSTGASASQKVQIVFGFQCLLVSVYTGGNTQYSMFNIFRYLWQYTQEFVF